MQKILLESTGKPNFLCVRLWNEIVVERKPVPSQYTTADGEKVEVPVMGVLHYLTKNSTEAEHAKLYEKICTEIFLFIEVIILDVP